MFLGDLKDVVDCLLVISDIGVGGDSDIVHVDMDSGAKGFMFEDDVAVDVVHHGLKGRWRIGESKIHDRRFEKPVSGFEHGLLLIAFMDAHVIVPPSHVKFHVNVCVA